jgi:hypothetical protein
MRKRDNAGMDAPWGWESGWVCVGPDEIVPISIAGGSTLSSSVDVLKAAIWWYDRRHETGTPIDDIDLYLRYTNGAELMSSASGTDEKERIFISNAGGKALKLEIVGDGVTADEECWVNNQWAPNKMKVYWAYFYEDSARNDTDGPTTAIEIE